MSKLLNTLGVHLQKCSSLRELESLYASTLKTNATQDCFHVNQFITSCSTFGRTDYALHAFTQIENPNALVYNAIIKAFVHCFSPVQALHFYLDMLRTQICPTSYTFSSIIKGCTLASALGCGEAIHGQVVKYGFGAHVYVQTGLVDFYSNMRRIRESRKVFDEMPERDDFVWTTMVFAHTRDGDLCSARKLFGEMPEKNIASWNVVVDGYARFGDVDSAESLFNEMPTKDLISWTTMINCYSQNKRYREALAVFDEMKAMRISPDGVTMTTVISSCAHVGELELAKEIHLYVMQNRFDLDVYMGSALIDMFAKCGSLNRSLVVFFKLQEKNLFCWNSVIDGLAVHGYAEEALATFRIMEREKIKPNGVTFISVLSACTHAGLIEEGRKRFLSMTNNYDILPEIEHYGCMVHLLCTAGLLDDALKLITSMRMEPNAVIWGALLVGCKIQKNFDIAHATVDKLSVLEPNNTGYHTLLLNMYAEANRWMDVAKIRAKMKELGVEKECPGSSWINLERKTHHFAASHKFHPASDKIYSILDGLCAQLKLVEYLPEIG